MIGAACLQHLERDRNKPHEIGWRLRRDRWGQGYASEAARAIVHHAFTAMQDVPFLVAVAHHDNAGSIGVMKKLGMRFDHAGTYWDLPAVLYRLDRDDYLKKAA
jgi:RimJ/RimL family protein N-acetyltransferase